MSYEPTNEDAINEATISSDGGNKNVTGALFRHKLESNDARLQSVETKPAEDRLEDDEFWGGLRKDLYNAVFDEYDRSILEGTETKEAIELRKTHVKEVERIVSESAEVLRQSGQEVSIRQERTAQMYAIVHDAMAHVPERQMIEYESQGQVIDNVANSGNDSWVAKLLRHPEDSAEWAEQIFSDLGFGPDFVGQITDNICTPLEKRSKAYQAITEHGGMPYVENVKQKAQVAAKLQETDSVRNNDPIALSKYEAVMATLPLYNERIGGGYPVPKSIEAALLFSADLLAPASLSGVGGFDRYIRINLTLNNREVLGQGLEWAFESAASSINLNIKRLKNPDVRIESADVAKIERIIGSELGVNALNKFDGFKKKLDEGINIAGKVYKGVDSLTVYNGDLGGVPFVDVNATMDNYYKAVEIYRNEEN